MNKLVKIQQNEISPWREFADEVLVSAIVGDLIFFRKSVWTRGEDKKPVLPTARFACVMTELSRGYVKWFDKRTVDFRLGRIVDGFKVPTRNELGDLDVEKWECDFNGEPRDPWVATMRLILIDMATREPVTFTTSSYGGRGALAKLCKVYDQGRCDHPDCWPVVKLEAETYNHRDFGMISKPSFVVVDWAPADSETGVKSNAQLEDEFANGPDVKAKPKRAKAKTPSTSETLNDEILY
jgi:hypothetical protein